MDELTLDELLSMSFDELAEDLEARFDQPAPPRTGGRLRPQALRQARARRSALLGRLTYRG